MVTPRAIPLPQRRARLRRCAALLSIVLLAFSVRLAFSFPHSIQPDSTYYMRFAQEILAGRFSVKLWGHIPDRFGEPLYPLFIAAGSRLSPTSGALSC